MVVSTHSRQYFIQTFLAYYINEYSEQIATSLFAVYANVIHFHCLAHVHTAKKLRLSERNNAVFSAHEPKQKLFENVKEE